MNNQLGIDLGTANTRICAKGEGILLRAPSVIAVRRESHAILSAGLDAKRMLGRTPHSVLAEKPIRGGAVADIKLASLMLGDFLNRLGATSVFRRPTVTACIPCGVGENAKRALEDACYEAGAGSVAFAEKPMAAAIGAGIRVASTLGGVLVDIGAGTTGVAVISHDGVVVSGVSKKAGDAFTEAVIEYLAKEHFILVGEGTAEAVKHRIGSLAENPDTRKLEITGKSAKMGGACRVYVSAAMLREALVAPANVIVNTIRKALEETPPELSSDITKYGLLLSGGGSMLHGLPEYIAGALGVRTSLSAHPRDDVALGLAAILDGGPEMARYIVLRTR